MSNDQKKQPQPAISPRSLSHLEIGLVVLVLAIVILLIAKVFSPGSSNSSGNTSVPAKAPLPAIIYLNPSSGSYSPGANITVEIHENSRTKAVNAVQADITYPTNELTLVSIDTADSPFKVQALNSGANGKISLVRGVIGPLKGDQLVAKLNFMVSGAAGTASLAWATTSHLVSSTTNKDILPGSRSAAAANFTIR